MTIPDEPVVIVEDADGTAVLGDAAAFAVRALGLTPRRAPVPRRAPDLDRIAALAGDAALAVVLIGHEAAPTRASVALGVVLGVFVHDRRHAPAVSVLAFDAPDGRLAGLATAVSTLSVAPAPLGPDAVVAGIRRWLRHVSTYRGDRVKLPSASRLIAEFHASRRDADEG